MGPRLKAILVCLITLGMVVFGQVCALSTLVKGVDPSVSDLAVSDVPATEDHAATCNPEDCAGEGGDEGHQGCPSGAASCCSTWGPPTSRLALSPPVSLRLALPDAWLAAADAHTAEDRAAEVALFELARPPCHPTGVLLASPLSRRGPPALS